MSNLIHCDGPGCDQVKPLQRRLCDGDWLMLEQGEMLPNLDFHSRQCLTAFCAIDAPGPASNAEEPCMCNGSQFGPHTKAEHQAYPTKVDGL